MCGAKCARPGAGCVSPVALGSVAQALHVPSGAVVELVVRVVVHRASSVQALCSVVRRSSVPFRASSCPQLRGRAHEGPSCSGGSPSLVSCSQPLKGKVIAGALLRALVEYQCRFALLVGHVGAWGKGSWGGLRLAGRVSRRRYLPQLGTTVVHGALLYSCTAVRTALGSCTIK